MENIINRVYLLIKVGVIVIPLAGFLNVAFLYEFILQNVTENGRAIRDAEVQLTQKIAAVEREIGTLTGALGESPSKIQEAAFAVSQARDEFVEIRDDLSNLRNDFGEITAEAANYTESVETLQQAILGLDDKLSLMGQQVFGMIGDSKEENRTLFAVARDIEGEISAIKKDLAAMKDEMQLVRTTLEQ